MQLPSPSVEPSPRRVRVLLGEEVIAESTNAQLLAWYGPGLLPTYAIPAHDVRTDILEVAPDAPALPHSMAYDVRIGDAIAVASAYRFATPPAPLATLDDHWTFTWDEGLRWFEEAYEVHVHARDTHKRVDAVPSDRHIRIELDGQVLADSHRPLALFETPLPARWYLPMEDVHAELLVASDTSSRCPYKGTANYWSARIGDAIHADVAWSYAEPVVECPRIAGLVAFFNERVDVFVDDVHQARPDTPWS